MIYKNIQRFTKTFQKLKKNNPKINQTFFTKTSMISENTWKILKKFKDLQKTSQDFKKHWKNSKNIRKFIKTFKNLQKHPKILKTF